MSKRAVGLTRRLRLLLAFAVVAISVAASMLGAPAVWAAAGSLVSGVVWADSALNQTRPATGAVYQSGVTVELIDPTNSAIVATTTTNASGQYSFSAVADGSYQILVIAPPNMKFPTTASGSNVFVSTGTPSSSTDPYEGISPTIVISGATQVTAQDAGVQPIATLNVQAITQPGYNCSNSSGLAVANTDNGNCNTNTLSSVSQAFAISISNLATGQAVHNVTATVVFTPANGAVLTMPALPSGCASSNVTPASSVSGNLTLVCNIGTISSAQIAAILPVVVPSPSSPNGSSFTTSVSVAAGDGTAVNSNTVANPQISITGLPNYATDKTVANNLGPGTYTVNGHLQLGYEIAYNIQGYPQTAKGSSQLALPLVIPDAGIPNFPNAVLISCTGPSMWANFDRTPVQNCPVGVTASAASPWNLTFTNYVPGGTYGYNCGGPCSYTVGPGQRYGTKLTVFVPAADMNRAADPSWQPGDPTPTGTVAFQNCLGAGENGKTDTVGNLNNGNGVMAGTPCASSSFSVAPGGFPSPIVAFKEYLIDGVATKDGWFVGPGEPNVQSLMQYVNSSSAPDPNFSMCDYFDVSTMQLTATTPVTTTNLPAGFRVEYGVGPNTTNDQVGTPATNSTYRNDPVYSYTNPDQSTIGTNCTRYTGQWNTNPSSFGANWQQQVNLVRIAPIPGFTPTPAAAAGSTVQLRLNFDVLSTYNGGPHAGQTIPTGAYIPNVGSWDNGPLDPTFASETAKVQYKQVLSLSTYGSKSYLKSGSGGGYGGLPSGAINGNGVYTAAGQSLLSWVGYNNNGQGPDTGFFLCDYFDVSTLQLNSVSMARPTNNGNGVRGTSLPPGYQFQYGVAPNTIDDQVGTPAVGSGYSSPIYQYSNTDQQSGAQSCKTSNANWTTTPATTFGANWQQQVNIVRVVPIPGFTPIPHAPVGYFAYMQLAFTVRGAYNGGPHAGQAIPQGAYIPNVGVWDTPQNTLSPLTTSTATIAFLAYQMGLNKTVNTSASYQPGSQIQWTITPSIQSGVSGHAITGVTVTDPIPANTTYDVACTNASLPNGVTATYNAASNSVTLAYSNPFNVSATLPQNLPAVTLCTNVLATAKPGVAISNTARVVSNEAPASVSSNAASVTLQGPGNLAISKSVNKPVIASGDTYTWNLTWGNSTTVAFAAPQIIDVLPYNNDGSSGASSERVNGSSTFAGTNVLTGAIPQPTYAAGSTHSGQVTGTWFYTTASPTTIEQNPGDPSNQNPGAGASIWVPAAAITNWSTVTGVYFSTSGFISGGDSVNVPITMQANAGGQLGDIYVNQAELYTSSAPNNPVVSNDPYTQIPGITIVKRASPTTVTAAGQTVTYTFTVSNQGQVSVNNVSVADTQTAPSVAASLGPITCKTLASPAGTCSGTILPTLAAGRTATFTASYVATQADVDHASIVDTAVANAVTNPGAVPITSQPSSALVTATQSPAIAVVKSGSPTTVFAAGQQVTYSFIATNTGSVTLSSVGITDTQIAPSLASGMGPIACVFLTSPSASCSGATTTLAPGQSATFTGTYTVTQADVNNGTVNDTATSHGTPPGTVTPIVSTPSAAVVSVTAAPGITVMKDSTTTTITHAGQQVPYTFLVTNTGNVTLSAIAVTDTVTSPSVQTDLSAVSCPVTTLVPGASTTCSATYMTSQADVDSGQVQDGAVASGAPPSTPSNPNPPRATSLPSTKAIPVVASPGIALVKSTTTSAVSRAGQQVPYTFQVTNSGNVTLSNVTVSDTVVAPSVQSDLSAVTCPVTTLAPGASTTCTATYRATQADLDNGSINDTATAQGTPPGTTTPVPSAPSSASVPVDELPAIALVKSASPLAAASFTVGQVITYVFVATNTGNVTLTNPTVTEGAFSGSGTMSAPSCPTTPSLAPGAQMVCTATYTVTQADVDAGGVTNDATATGSPPSGPPVTSPPSQVAIPAPEDPGITLVKSATPAIVTGAGQTVSYSFLVKNTGNVTLTNPIVTEGFFTGSGQMSAVNCPATVSMPPGAQLTCTASYAVTQADVDAGSITNVATATGTPPSGPPVTSPISVATVTANSTASITLVKTADLTALTAAGQTVTYSFLVTNTGNVTLGNIEVDEQQFSGTGSLSTVSCPAGATALAPGSAVTCTASYTATQADIDAGGVTNTATATGTPPSGPPPISAPSDVAIPANALPAISLVKTADRSVISAVGQTVNYSFLITNTGNVTLTDAGVVEGAFTGTGTMTTPTCPSSAAALAPGQAVTCTASYAATAADFAAGSVANTATATGTPPGGGSLASDPSTVQLPTLALSTRLADTGVNVPLQLVIAAIASVLFGQLLLSAHRRRFGIVGGMTRIARCRSGLSGKARQ